MVDREQGRGARTGESKAEDRAASGDASPEPGRPEADDEAAEFERVMEIGRKVMMDHHAVLAALAR